MANFEIPKGFVFVPRYYSNDRNQAAELLAAADEVGVDQAVAVVTVSNGYHVKKKVAAKWAEQYDGTVPEADVQDDLGETDDDGLIKVGNAGLAGAEIIGVAPGEDDGDAGDDAGETGEPEPLPVTAESSNAEIDAYAAGLDPAVDLSGASNRVEKIALLEAARVPATPEPTTPAE